MLRRTAAVRELFDIPASIAYLNAAYLTPSLKATTAAAALGASRKAHPWTVTKDHFFSDAARARELFASLVHGRASEVAIVPSASYAVATAAANLMKRVSKAQNIVTLAGEHPSNRFAWQLASQGLNGGGSGEGCTLRIVPAPHHLAPGVSYTDAVLGAIDEARAPLLDRPSPTPFSLPVCPVVRRRRLSWRSCPAFGCRAAWSHTVPPLSARRAPEAQGDVGSQLPPP